MESESCGTTRQKQPTGVSLNGPEKVLGLAPESGFSGFENSFFNATEKCGLAIRREYISDKLLWYACTLTTLHPNLKQWAGRRDRAYHASIRAFVRKSEAGQRVVGSLAAETKMVYQIGALWNPMPKQCALPLALQVDYTSILSTRRNSEWRRKAGREASFWTTEERRLYDRATVILTSTENARRSLIEDYAVPASKIVTTGVGVNQSFLEPQPQSTPAWNSRKILFIGKGWYGKGLDTLLQALPLVRSVIPAATLTVVGPRFTRIDVDGVHFLGRIRDTQAVRGLYSGHAVFAMPSRVEPVGQVFLEAMASQLPCVGTRVDAMPELIEDGKTGALVEPGDHAALAECLIAILSRPDQAERMGRAGFLKLQQQFTWDVVGARIASVLKDCL